MKGVLVIAHGSRAKETELTLEAVLQMVRLRLPDTVIRHAYMEFSDLTIDMGIADLASCGVTEIKVVPYFLFTGVHIKEDIPSAVAECMKGYPNIKLTMGNTLGADERLADILADRIRSDSDAKDK